MGDACTGCKSCLLAPPAAPDGCCCNWCISGDAFGLLPGCCCCMVGVVGVDGAEEPMGGLANMVASVISWVEESGVPTLAAPLAPEACCCALVLIATPPLPPCGEDSPFDVVPPLISRSKI